MRHTIDPFDERGMTEALLKLSSGREIREEQLETFIWFEGSNSKERQKW